MPLKVSVFLMAKEKAEKSMEKAEKKHVPEKEKEKESGAIKEIAEEIKKEEEKKEEKEDIQQEMREQKPAKKSKKKKGKEKPVWIEYKPKEIEELVINLSNQGHSASEIGAILRDQHGVLDVRQATKKTILKILTEAGIKQDVPEDLLYLIKKAVALNEHLKKNKKDASAKRGYEMAVSKIRKLVKYYIKTKRLPSDWRYSIETATLLVK